MKTQTMTHATTSHTNGRPGMETASPIGCSTIPSALISARDSRETLLMVIATGSLFTAHWQHPVQAMPGPGPCFSANGHRTP